jgi:hypothetical protein
MIDMIKKQLKNKALSASFAALLGIISIPTAQAQIDMAQQPVLIITNKAMQPSNLAPIYSRPSRAPEITQEQISSAAFSGTGSTMVGGKIESLSKDLFAIQSSVGRLSERLNAIEYKGKNIAAGYYASVATINTSLQTGTTPGNPRLVQNLDTAQTNLDTLSDNVGNLNSLAVEIADSASKATYLLNTIRSTYNLTGAVEEDHARLAQMEDQVNSSVVSIDRLLNEVNDDISRTAAYLTTERNNMRTLSLAVTNGDLYGGSLANHPFSRAPQSSLYQQSSYTPPVAPAMAPMAGTPRISSPVPMAQPAVMASAPTRPLAKIRFDKPNVNYEQPIYNAVQNAMTRYPNARFELIAVHPTSGNAAQTAIESTRSRRNAERVLRTLTQMGVPLDQIDLSYAPSADARSSEVHLFLR